MEKVIVQNTTVDDEKSESYELAFVLAEKEDERIVSDLLMKLDALVAFAREAEKINLAYPIGKRSSGFFGFFDFSLARDKVETLRKELLLQPKVLRFLLVKWPEKYVKQNMKFYGKRDGETVEGEGAQEAAKDVSNEMLEAKLQELLK